MNPPKFKEGDTVTGRYCDEELQFFAQETFVVRDSYYDVSFGTWLYGDVPYDDIQQGAEHNGYWAENLLKLK